MRRVALVGVVLVLLGGAVPAGANPVSASGTGASFNTSGSGTTPVDNAIIRGDASVSPIAIQGGACVEDDNGGVDCPAHPTNGGKLTLKEGADDGTNVLSIAIPDVGGLDRDVAIVATAHGGLNFNDPRSYVDLSEEFLAGDQLATSGFYGPFSLRLQGFGGGACASTVQQVSPSFDRQGVARFGNDATNSQACGLRPGTTQANLVGMSTNLGWFFEGAFAIVTNTSVAMYWGLGDLENQFPTNEFIGIRFDTSADGTTFKCLGITGSVAGATTNIAVTADTAQHYFRVEHDPAAGAGTAQIKCTVDTTSVTGVTDHVPAANISMHVYTQIKNLSASARLLDLDFWHLFYPVNR